MYIDGKFVDSASKATFDVYDPATEGVIATCPAGNAQDVGRAVEAAKRAFYGGWKTTSAQERGRILMRIADRIRARRDELATIETLNSGKPIVESEYDMDDSAVCFEYYGGLATKINGEVIPGPHQRHGPGGQGADGRRRADHPLELPAGDGGLEAGPRPCRGLHRRHQARRADAAVAAGAGPDFEAVGLPPGVVNIVTGLGPDAGGPLVVHPDVRKIAFTGSAEIGKLIMRNASDQLKRVSLELGGKSPNIFFSDADFEAAVDGALFGTFINQGEVCSAGSRVLVQQDIYKKFVDACAAKAKTIRLGPGIERETKMGPLVSAEQRDRVRKYQEIGKKEAKVAAGGGAPKFDKGWYVEPTIFYDVDNSARIAQEEIFGPVMSVIPFKDEAQALEIANATPYGLAAAVWTRDIFKAFRVVKSLEAGIVWVNHMQPTMMEAPWGGYKMSGFGRELGHWGVEEYMETKQVYINLDEAPIAWY